MEIQAMNEEILSQNDQLQDMVKELEAFSYSISHDLRAPLRSLIGYSKMLEEDFNEKLDEEGRRMLNVIQHNAARMNNMIDDLLKFSKLGKTELQKFKIDSEKLLKNILAEINISTQHNAEIKLNPVPPIFADSELISQVWINLISNAIKYSAKKETPVVEIGSYSDGDEVVFYIKDNGAGFDMKYVDKLFGVFQRLHKMDEFEGTGVGLALVHRIVAKHGGRVWAEGEVNQGATFYFSLLS
jgi:light-regulated signal transduction histidine kinase (bacteriophytochrome)